MIPNRKTNWVVAGVLGGLALLAAPAPPQKNGQAEVLFERAVQKETVDGDLKAALDLYKQIVAKPGGNRGVAAKALIRMGQCYEKLGDADARKAYERVVREFADQKDAVAEARRRLAGKGGQPERGVVARLIERPAGVGERVHEVSRDGRFLVCTGGEAGKRGIYLRDVETGETRTILRESPRMRWPLRLSPDGSQIAYILRDLPPGRSPSELNVVRTDGSGLRVFTAKDLQGTPRMPSLWDWSPDGQSLLLAINSEDGKGKVILVRASDGAVRVLGSAAGISTTPWSARFSPDGRFIAVMTPPKTGYIGENIAILTVDGLREIPLVTRGVRPLWTPDGKQVLFVSNRRGPTDLWAIPVANGQAAGPPELVRENFSGDPLSLTRDGELFYTTSAEMRDLYTVEFDPRTGRPTSKAVKITDRYVNAGSAWSPDGRLLAYVSLRDGKQPGEGEPASLVIRTMATGNERVVTPKIMLEMNLSNPQWFPDGRSLLIQPQWGQQAGKLAKVDIETGDVQLLLNGASPTHRSTWYNPGTTLSPDGRMLYYTSANSRTQQVRILRRELPSGEEKEVRSLKAEQGFHISVSPDGSRLAFWVRPDEKDQKNGILMTMPAEGGELSQVKTGSVVPWTNATAWSRDGRRIFFVGLAKPGAGPEATQDCDIWSVPVEGGEPVPLGIGLHTIWFFHLHPDGKRLVFYDEFSKGELWSLKNLLGGVKALR